MKGQQWYESPKGYVTTVDRVKMVVFWDYRTRGWKHVCDGQFSDLFHDLDAALDSAERELGIAGMVNRKRCRDVAPDQREGATPVREHAHAHDAGRRGAGTRFRNRRPGLPPEPKPAPTATRVRIDELVAPLFRSPPPGATAAKTPVQLAIEANLAKRQPPWARFLGLKGPPPYTLDQVKTAFRAAAKIAHPDAGGSATLMAQVNEAYELGLAAVANAPPASPVAPPAPAPAPQRAPAPAAAAPPVCYFCRQPMVRRGVLWGCVNPDCEPPF